MLSLDHIPALKYECMHGYPPDQTEVTVHVNGQPQTIMFSALVEGDIISIPGHEELYKIVATQMSHEVPYVLCDPYDPLQ